MRRRGAYPIPLRRGGGQYFSKVLGIEPANLIAYWPLWEASGSVADNVEGTAARDGAYTGVTLGQTGIGDGRTVPLFDGVNDYVDCYTTSLRDAFNGAEGTLGVWAKVYDADRWSDGQSRDMVLIRVDANNYIRIDKTGAANGLNLIYSAGGTLDFDGGSGVGGELGFILYIMSWSVSGDKVRYGYYKPDGTELRYAEDTGLGTWAGNISLALIGAGTLGPPALTEYYGWEGHVMLWDKALVQSQFQTLAEA